MILNFIRGLLILLIFLIILIDINVSVFFNKSENQLVIAIIIIFMIIFVDPVIGFLFGLIFLIIYFKFYLKMLNDKKVQLTEFVNKQKKNEEKETFEVNKVVKMAYISPEILISAQSNIVDENSFKTEIKGFNNNLYGIQGLNFDKLHYQGYDPKNDYNTL